MKRRFSILDVFSNKPMAGNQLAVVYDSEGLDEKTMQQVAAQFGFSETVFLAPAQDANHSASVRIFTPVNELPFAGHPTVGSAIAVARERGMQEAGQGIVVLEEKVGPVRCGVRFEGDDAYAEFDLPILPKRSLPPRSKEAVAAALGLAVDDLGFENHVLSMFDGGVPYDLVPVKNLDAVTRAMPNVTVWREAFGDHSHNCAYVYCRETVGHDHHFHARMFGPDAGIFEDAATGSAAASFSGAIALFDDLPDGLHNFQIEQGMEMGRPSLIHLEIEMTNGDMTGGRIGGDAVEFASGTLEI